MSAPLTDSHFLPLILNLPHDEHVRLARLALRGPAHDNLSAAPALTPNELSLADEPLAWDAEG
jgi:hypothetical protein